jgi:predicted GIY-YIG superfamily endonuclease
MYYVYLLQSLKNKSLYIGCTSNLKKRLMEHNSKKVYHTSKYAPWKIYLLRSFH